MAVALPLLAVRADLRSHLQQRLEVVLGQRSGVEVGRSEQMLVRIRDDFEDTFGCGFLPLFRCRGGERLGVAALFFLFAGSFPLAPLASIALPSLALSSRVSIACPSASSCDTT